MRLWDKEALWLNEELQNESFLMIALMTSFGKLVNSLQN